MTYPKNPVSPQKPKPKAEPDKRRRMMLAAALRRSPSEI